MVHLEEEMVHSEENMEHLKTEIDHSEVRIYCLNVENHRLGAIMVENRYSVAVNAVAVEGAAAVEYSLVHENHWLHSLALCRYPVLVALILVAMEAAANERYSKIENPQQFRRVEVGNFAIVTFHLHRYLPVNSIFDPPIHHSTDYSNLAKAFRKR